MKIKYLVISLAITCSCPSVWADEDQEMPEARMVCSADYTVLGKSYSATDVFEIPLNNAFPETVGNGTGSFVSFELPHIDGSFVAFPTFEVETKGVAEKISAGIIEFPRKRVRTGKVTGLGFRHTWKGYVDNKVFCTPEGEKRSGYVATSPTATHNLGVYPLRKKDQDTIGFSLDHENVEIDCGLDAAKIDDLTVSCDIEADNADYALRGRSIVLESKVVTIYSGGREVGKEVMNTGDSSSSDGKDTVEE